MPLQQSIEGLHVVVRNEHWDGSGAEHLDESVGTRLHSGRD